MYPPTSENLINAFKEQADPTKTDATFNNIVQKAEDLEKANPDPHRQFSDLMTAIGTNNIQPYFPYVDVANEERPTYALLNMLQRKTSGKIKLGIDLQGGTQFLVSLDTNHMVTTDTNGAKTAMATDERQRLVTQAAEVLRRRVDNIGVAEPVIQPAGETHILIQLPGLSQANQDEARRNINGRRILNFGWSTRRARN